MSYCKRKGVGKAWPMATHSQPPMRLAALFSAVSIVQYQSWRIRADWPSIMTSPPCMSPSPASSACPVGHDDRVVALGYLDGLEIGTAIEDDVDIVPRVASGMVLQSEGHEAVLGGEKLQVLAYQVGAAQAEGRMGQAEMDQALVVVEDLGIALEVVPVEVVDLVGRLEGVVHALLGAQHLLAAEQEGHALGGEDGRLGQQVEADEGLLVKLRLGHGGTEAVGQTEVVRGN